MPKTRWELIFPTHDYRGSWKTNDAARGKALIEYSLLQAKSFYHAATAPWRVEKYKAIEIDDLSDFIAAEALMKAKLEGTLE